MAHALQKGKAVMRKTQPQKGFTLIELMIVVGILAVLAAVAMTSYSAYVRKSRNSEATSILADIRLKQEAYRGAFQEYASGCGAWVPRATPDAESAPASGMSDECTTTWRRLGIVFPNSLYFVYDTEAGPPGTDPSKDRYDAASSARDFWYGAAAIEDLNSNGKCGGFVVVSGEMKITEIPETEAACTY